MSMIGNLRLISESKFEVLMRDPERIEDFVCEDDEGDDEDDEPDRVDIDKAWHALHLLLTGSAWGGDAPLNFLVSGGTQIGEVDVGYGPARGFNSAEVRAIAAALAKVTLYALRERFDPKAMARADIYPSIWDDIRVEEAREYVLDYFEVAKDFVVRGAKDGKAMIVFVN